MHARISRPRLSISTLASVLTLPSLAPLAQAQELEEPLPSTYAGHVYINMRTGERIVTPANEPGGSHRSVLEPLFINEDTLSNGNLFFGLDTPTRRNAEMLSWGDLPFDSRVDAFKFSYATNIAPDSEPQVMGLDAVLWWFDCEHNAHPISFVPLYCITIEDLNGTPDVGFFGSWIYTIDLSGSGLEFEIGDTDGSYTGASGVPSTGCDKDDTDGSPLADFSWSYQFRQNQAGPLGIIGPSLALPDNHSALGEDDMTPTGGDGMSRGIPDRFALYFNPNGGTREQLVSYGMFFGGWPSGTYGSTYTGLYANSGPDCSIANYNNDAGVDILDFLDFFSDFGPCENQPAPCGTVSDADLTGDTIVDILDFLEFFEYFGVCS